MFPTLFYIGPFAVHSYGLLLAIGFLVGLRVSIYYGNREDIPQSRIVDLVLYLFLAALAGAKLLIVIVDFPYYRQDWTRLLHLYRVGGVYYGGLILASVVCLVYVRRQQMNFWRTADALCMGLAAGQALGRIGCFLAGCCWGQEVSPDFALAVIFRSVEAAQQVGVPLFIPLHPTQLYEAFATACLFAVLSLLYRRKHFHGQQLFLYLILYSSLRFGIEFFRGDPRGAVLNGAMSTSQLISILVLAVALPAGILRCRAGKTGEGPSVP